jgi:hypothetical protein
MPEGRRQLGGPSRDGSLTPSASSSLSRWGSEINVRLRLPTVLRDLLPALLPNASEQDVTRVDSGYVTPVRSGTYTDESDMATRPDVIEGLVRVIPRGGSSPPSDTTKPHVRAGERTFDPRR